MSDEIMVDSIKHNILKDGQVKFDPDDVILDGRSLDKLFVVCPRQESTHYDQYLYELKTRAEIYPKYDEIPPKLLRPFKKADNKLRTRIIKEVERNAKEIIKRKGQNVGYQEEIHLMHYESKMFLSNYFEAGGIKGFTLKLTQFPDQESVFKITSPFRNRMESKVIQMDDPVYIQHVKSSYFLNIREGSHFYNMDDDPSTLNPFKIKINVSDHGDQVCALSEVQKYRWKFYFSAKHSFDEDDLQNLDIIRIYYPQYKGGMCSDIKYDCEHPELYIRCYEGTDMLETSSSTNLWLIKKDHFKKEEITTGANCCGNFLKQDGIYLQNLLSHAVVCGHD
jgi:hypothetical protein